MSQRVELIIGCINDTRKALQEITSSFQGMVAKFAAWNYSLQSAFRVAEKALNVVVLQAVNVGDELYKMSQKTGISVEELYRLKSIAELSDVSLDEMGITLGALSRNLFEAKTKAGDARAIFDALGIDTAQPLNKIFSDLAKRFSEMRDGEDKMALAMQLFGRSGQQIIPVLHEVARGGHDIASAFSEESARAASDFSDSVVTLKRNLSELSIAIGNELIPPLNKMLDILNSKAVRSLAPLLNALAGIRMLSKGIDTALDDTIGKEIPEVNQAIEPRERKGPAPKITTEAEIKKATDDRRKWMEWEWQYADTVDKAGQEILDDLNKREQAYKEYQEQVQAGREAEINLQLKQIDLAEQEFRISKSDAVKERIRLQQELLAIQEEYLVTLDKSLDPASWYAQQNAIDATRESLVQLNLQLKEQTGTFTEGAKYGFQQYLHDANTAFQLGAQIARDTAQAMQSSFDVFFFDVMEGELDSLEDYLIDFLTSIQRALSSVLAQMATQGFLDLAGGFFAPKAPKAPQGPIMIHSGGYIPRFHVGGLAADEIPAILQRGEYVVSRKGVDALDRINSGRGSAPNVTINIQNQTGKQVSATQDNMRFDGEKYIVNVILKNIDQNGPLRTAFAGLR